MTMFLFDWFYSVLASLGLRQKKANILFLGPDNAGKTHLLNMLKDEINAAPADAAPEFEELSIGNIKFKAFNLGDLRTTRRVLDDCYVEVDAVIFLVNARDRWQIWDLRMLLGDFMRDESFANVPFLVLGYGFTDPDSKIKLCHHLGLFSCIVGNVTAMITIERAMSVDVRPVEVFMYNIYRNTGYKDGFKWLSQYIK